MRKTWVKSTHCALVTHINVSKQDHRCIREWHDDVIKWINSLRYWPFARGIHRSPVNSPHKDQWRRALIFSLIWAWINGWINNRDADDLRHHRAHYDVIVMVCHLFGTKQLHELTLICDQLEEATTLQRRHDERDGGSNHRSLDVLLSLSFKCTWTKTPNLHVIGLSESRPVTDGFPSHRASNAENISIWWGRHDFSKIWIKIQAFSFGNNHWKMTPTDCRLFGLKCVNGRWYNIWQWYNIMINVYFY